MTPPMTAMSRLGAMALALALTQSLAGARAETRAETAPPSASPRDQAEQVLKEGVEKIMRGLDLLMQTVPQFAAPRVTENGDIIIRRTTPPPPAKKPAPTLRDDEAAI